MHSLMKQYEFWNYLFFKFEQIWKILFFPGKKLQMLQNFHLDRIKSVILNASYTKLLSQENNTPTPPKKPYKTSF